MNGFDFPGIRSSQDRDPLLVSSASSVPLNDLSSTSLLLLSNINGLPIQHTLQEISASLLNPSPSLVEPLILLILDQTLSVLECSPRNINSFSRCSIDEDACFVEGKGVVDGDDVEQLVEDIGVEISISQNSFQSNGLSSFGRSLKPERVSIGPFDLKELIAALLAKSQLNFASFLIPHKIGNTANNLKLIIPMANFLNHPQLGKVIGVRSCSNSS